MDIKTFIGYIITVIIGTGFIMMAVSDTLHSEAASILQVISGIVFVGFGIKKKWKNIENNGTNSGLQGGFTFWVPPLINVL